MDFDSLSREELVQCLTEARSKLEMLREELAQTQALGRCGSWTRHPGTGVVTGSAGLFRLFGLDVDQPLTEELMLAAMHPEDRSLARKGRSEVFPGKPSKVEYRIESGGSEIWVEEHIEAEAYGPALRLVGIVRDITERKWAEQAQAREAQIADRLRKITATAPGAVLSYRQRPDGSCCFPHTSPAVEELYGIKRDILAEDASPVFARMPEEDLKHVRQKIEESLRDLSPWHAEFRYAHPWRGEIWLEGRSMPQKEGDGGYLWHGVVHEITERKCKELAIQGKLRSYLEHAPWGVMSLNLEGRVLEFNPAARRMLGPCLGAAFDRPLDQWPLGSEGLTAKAYFEAAKATGYGEAVFRLQPESGSDMYLSANIIRMSAEQFLLMVQDISPRMRSEAELRKSEHFVRAVFNSVPAEMAILNRAGEIVAANESWIGSLSGPQGARDLIASNYLEFCRSGFGKNAASGLALHDGILAVLNGEKSGIVLDYPCESEGERRWVHVSVTPMADAWGGVVISRTDITERKAIEEYYRGLVEDQTEIICRFLGDGTILYVNDAYCRMFGKSREDLIGKSWQPEAWAEDVPYIEAQLETLSPAHPVVIIENRIVTAGGELRWGQFVNRGFFDGEGRLVELQAVGRDITDRKRIEARNRELYQFLAQIADRVPGVIFQFRLNPDDSGSFPYASEAIREFFAVTPEAAERDASPVFAALHPADRDAVLASLRRSSVSLELWESEFRVRDADGAVRWLQGNALPSPGPDASVLWHGYISDVSERKRSEQRLLETEKRFLDILNNFPGLVFIKGLDGRYLLINRRCADLLGIAETDAIGKTTHELMPAEIADRLVANDRRVLEGQEFQQVEEVLMLAGSPRTFLSFQFPLRNSDDTVYATCGISTDVTERKLLEQRFAESKKLIEDLYEHAPCGYHSLGPDGTYRHINATELKWLGCERDEVVGKLKPTDFFTEEGKALFKRVFPRFLREGFIENVDFELLGRDGTRRHVVVSATAVRGPDGAVLMSRSVCHDVTERKQAEEALARKSRELSVLLDTIPAPVFFKDRESRHLAANRAYCHFCGLPVEHILGKTNRDLFPPDQADLHEEYDRVVLESGQLIIGAERELRDSRGHSAWYSTFKTPIRGEDGEILGLVGLSVDISELKRDEAARIALLERQRDTLIREVHHRIKNHLQGITGLLRTSMGHYPESAGPLQETIGQIRTIAQVYGLQSRRGDATILLHELLDAALQVPIGPVAPDYACAEGARALILSQEMAVPVALTVNELLTNAQKHLTPIAGAGRVSVALRTLGGTAKIRIANCPARLPEDFDFSLGRGLGTGLELVRGLLSAPGVELAVRQDEQTVVAELMLSAPAIHVGRAGLAKAGPIAGTVPPLN